MFRLFSNIVSNVQSWQSLYISIKILIKLPLNWTHLKLEMARLTHLISHYTEYTLIVRKVLAKSVTRTSCAFARQHDSKVHFLPSLTSLPTLIPFMATHAFRIQVYICNWNVSQPNIWRDIGGEPVRRSIANGRRVFDDR